MAYTSDKKPGALTAATSLADSNNLVVEQSGSVVRASLSQLETKMFGSKTEKTTVDGSEIVVVRQSDDTLRQVALNNIVKAGLVTNAMVSASAAIVDTKLATISTAGKVTNAATTATSSNTSNAIVARDSNGDFTARVITATTFSGTLNGSFVGNVTGNADTATKWATARNLSLTGDVTATLSSVDGSAAVSAAATLATSGVVAGTYNDNAAEVRPFTVDAKGRVTSIGSAVPISLDVSSVTGGSYKKNVRVATTAALTVTYSNGTSGVGATLTNAGSPAAISIDGVALSLNDRVLVKDQASGLQNGIYAVTTVGTIATSWVLTRATDADTAAEAAAALVSVSEGTTNGGKTFTSGFKATDTVGTGAQSWLLIGGNVDNSTIELSSGTLQIKDAGVTAAKLAGTLDLSTKTVTLPSGSVNAAALASDAVETAKILNGNVTAPKLNGVGKDTSGVDMSVGTAPVFGVRAWVRFDATRNAADTGASVNGDPVKILGAGNVSSVVRGGSGAGRYTVNFATAAPHANYAAVAGANVLNSEIRNNNAVIASCHSHSTTSVQVLFHNDGGGESAAPQTANVCVIY
jgi:hypothetical protein